MKTTKGISATTGQPFSIEEEDDQDSVEITLNAKGEAQISVKCYGSEAYDASSNAVAALARTKESLRENGVRIAGDPKEA